MIAAYFDSAGREVEHLVPCPNFHTFMAEHNLFDRDVQVVLDLPHYIIPAGLRILQADRYESPNHDWLPVPPDTSSFGRSGSLRTSLHRSLDSSRPLLTSSDRSCPPVANAHRRPDPDGVGFDPRTMQRVPSQVFMGGSVASYGGVSTMTARSMGGNPLSPHRAPSLASTPQSIFFDPVPIESVGT